MLSEPVVYDHTTKKLVDDVDIWEMIDAFELPRDGFGAGVLYGYRSAVTQIIYQERPPPPAAYGKESYLDGVDCGYRAAREDIEEGRPIRYQRLGLAP